MEEYTFNDVVTEIVDEAQDTEELVTMSHETVEADARELEQEVVTFAEKQPGVGNNDTEELKDGESSTRLQPLISESFEEVPSSLWVRGGVLEEGMEEQLHLTDEIFDDSAIPTVAVDSVTEELTEKETEKLKFTCGEVDVGAVTENEGVYSPNVAAMTEGTVEGVVVRTSDERVSMGAVEDADVVDVNNEKQGASTSVIGNTEDIHGEVVAKEKNDDGVVVEVGGKASRVEDDGENGTKVTVGGEGDESSAVINVESRQDDVFVTVKMGK